MFDAIFSCIFDSTSSSITVWQFLGCVATGLVLGLIIAAVYAFKNKHSVSFLVTLILLPAIVAVVIIMVNGNIGAGIAVAGAFSLVRFRSVPGSAKDIATIFLAMVAGIVTGTGYIGYAVLFTIVICAVMLVLQLLGISKKFGKTPYRTLRITVPEDLNYTEIYDDLFERYTDYCENVSIKTTNMGSLYKLTYDIKIKDPSEEKAFIDELRCRNGNLEVSICRQETTANEL
ncbi:MAG: DUF4956 domain-containing protein [Clostridia bacterium]|nr:DUF4956 domain-containing protein [Clostridia bacterium]